MKRLLYWVGVPLIITVTFTASLRWPEFVIWVAWMLAALLWFSASVVGGEAEEAKRSRDRWASLARKAEAEVDRLERQLEKRQAEVENLRGAIDKFAELVDAQEAEIGRLKGELEKYEEGVMSMETEETRRGPDPDCPNCDGYGSHGFYPNGPCGVCWTWDPADYPDRVDGKWPEVAE